MIITVNDDDINDDTGIDMEKNISIFSKEGQIFNKTKGSPSKEDVTKSSYFNYFQF